MLKSLFVLENRLNKKAKVNFEIYDVAEWTPNNYNAHLTQYFGKQRQNQAMEFGQLIEYNVRNNFLQKSCRK